MTVRKRCAFMLLSSSSSSRLILSLSISLALSLSVPTPTSFHSSRSPSLPSPTTCCYPTVVYIHSPITTQRVLKTARLTDGRPGFSSTHIFKNEYYFTTTKKRNKGRPPEPPFPPFPPSLSLSLSLSFLLLYLPA